MTIDQVVGAVIIAVTIAIYATLTLMRKAISSIQGTQEEHGVRLDILEADVKILKRL